LRENQSLTRDDKKASLLLSVSITNNGNNSNIFKTQYRSKSSIPQTKTHKPKKKNQRLKKVKLESSSKTDKKKEKKNGGSKLFDDGESGSKDGGSKRKK
jgi:hypothetical protein